MTEYQKGDTVWFVNKRQLEMYECEIQDYIDGYYYAFFNDDNGSTMLSPIHIDNLRTDERTARKELFKLRLQKERNEDLCG